MKRATVILAFILGAIAARTLGAFAQDETVPVPVTVPEVAVCPPCPVCPEVPVLTPEQEAAVQRALDAIKAVEQRPGPNP